MKLVNALRTRDSRTENGAATNSTTLSACLDFFSSVGAMRAKAQAGAVVDLTRLYEAARAEDPSVARRILFWARDVRGGAGEREAFRIIAKHASLYRTGDLQGKVALIPEYGRWDDLFCLIGTPLEAEALAAIKAGLENGDRLLAKWIPRGDSRKSPEKRAVHNAIRRHLGLSPGDFRRTLSGLTEVVETPMCAKSFAAIDYSKVPSLAAARYQKAFLKNDPVGYATWKAALEKGEAKVNAGAVYPYDVTKSLMRGDSAVASAQWKALPNYLEGSTRRILPMCDVSGSMSSHDLGGFTAMDVCLSLGLYISERNEGPFKDAFLTFSTVPELQVLKGDLSARFHQLIRSKWSMSTNLEAAFELVLAKAIEHRIPESEMPNTVLILSDMEFNACADGSALDMIRERYEAAGYQMPELVFWNLASRGQKNYPAQEGDDGVAMVSGFSPSLLKSVLAARRFEPVDTMMEVVGVDRYAPVA